MTVRTVLVVVLTAAALASSSPGHGGPAPAVLPLPLRAPDGPISLTVTGEPIHPVTLNHALAVALVARGVVPAGTRVSIERPETLLPMLIGKPAPARVRVGAAAPGFAPAWLDVPVVMERVDHPWHDADALYVSNSPERVTSAKGLFLGTMRAGEAVRLLYHHTNGMRAPLRFEIAAANPGDAPVRLWATWGTGGPGPYELWAGHEAGRDFLAQYVARSGQVVTIPPHTTRRLAVQVPAPGEVVAGVAQLWLMEGRRVHVLVQTRLTDATEPPTESYAINRDLLHLRGIFLQPHVRLNLKYQAGARPVEITLGDQAALRAVGDGRTLEGDYGITYTIQIELRNLSATPKTVHLTFIPKGGPAGGTFSLGGLMYEIRLAEPGKATSITDITLLPGARQQVPLITMPQGGSYYPVRFVVWTEPGP